MVSVSCSFLMVWSGECRRFLLMENPGPQLALDFHHPWIRFWGGRAFQSSARQLDEPLRCYRAMRQGGWANANLRTQFVKILERAKVQAWARLFHSMRASRETDLLAEGFQNHIVCAWLGNSIAVADQHYNLVTDGDIEQSSPAAQNPARSERKAARNPAPQPAGTDHAPSTQETKKARHFRSQKA